jgi:hypothetical protein
MVIKLQYKAFPIFLTCSFLFMQCCGAQSIVGKWERNFSHLFSINNATGKPVYLSPEIQKQYDEANASNGYKEILEMKKDNTYTSTVTAGGKQTIHSGNYSLSGNSLEMNMPLVNGQKTIITVIELTAYSMKWNLVFIGKSTGVEYVKI